MSNIFFASDHHFSHIATITKFRKHDGCTPLRPFKDIDEMNETMVDNHNKIVRKNDIVWFLGDITMDHRNLHILHRLSGHKRLIMGNHDNLPAKDYYQYFDEVHPLKIKYNMIMSHIPLHESSVVPRFDKCLHGHLHGNVINHPAYLCVSVEQINYTPISLEDVIKRFDDNKEKYDRTKKVNNYNEN